MRRSIRPLHAVRQFSNYRTQKINITSIFENTEPTTRSNVLLGTSKDYPFPGQVTCEALNPKLVSNRVDNEKPKVFYYTFNVNHFLAPPVIRNEAYQPESPNDVCRWNTKIELVAIKCPIVLRKDLTNLFPTADLKKAKVTLINFYEVIEDGAEQEDVSLRDKADSFILAANSVCATLRNYGFWADFIDPHSSKSRLDGNSFQRLMNQNEKFDFAGINVTDNNNCNLVEQTSLHTTPFIGSVFTTACRYSPVVQKIVNTDD